MCTVAKTRGFSEHEGMQSAFYIIITSVIILGAAVSVIGVLFITRRSASDWQDRLRSTTEDLRQHRLEAFHQDNIEVHKTTLRDVIREQASVGSAYLRAEELPRLDRRGD